MSFLSSSSGARRPVTRLELPLHYVSTVDCEDLALLRQKVEVVTCELLSRDSVRTSLLSRDKAHMPQLLLFTSVIRGGRT